MPVRDPRLRMSSEPPTHSPKRDALTVGDGSVEPDLGLFPRVGLDVVIIIVIVRDARQPVRIEQAPFEQPAGVLTEDQFGSRGVAVEDEGREEPGPAGEAGLVRHELQDAGEGGRRVSRVTAASCQILFCGE